MCYGCVALLWPVRPGACSRGDGPECQRSPDCGPGASEEPWHTRKGRDVDGTNLQTADRNERLALIVDRCLESEAAYKLFDMLGAVSQLEVEAKLKYVELVRESGMYSDDEISAIERLVLSGTAQYLKEAIDQVRDEQIQREIAELVA